MQSRSLSGGLPTAGDLTGGPAVSGDSFHSELEAALRRADVSPEGLEERAAADRKAVADNEYGRDPKTSDRTASYRSADDAPEAKAASEASRDRKDETAPAKGGAGAGTERSAEEVEGTESAGKTESTESTESTAAAETTEAAEMDKRKRLLGIREPGQSRDGEALHALDLSAAEDGAAKVQKLSPALKGGADLASGLVPPETEQGTVETALRPGKTDKANGNQGESALREVHGNAEAGQAAKGAAASNLSAREIPRGPLDNGSRKGIRAEGEQDAQGDKDAGKNAIRTTVVSRSRNFGETDGSGGRHSALQDAPGRSDPSVVKETSDGPRFDTPSLDAARSGPASANRSSLEGSRDVAPRHLHQQLKDFATGDVVRHARFVIKENAGGEIRLLLKPEQLGTVRVRLEVQDNRIAGRIIVENSTVRDAFEQTLSDLHRAFREAGLETGSLEVTVGEDGQASGRQQTAQGRRARAVEELAKSVPTVIGELDEPRMINVYA